ncbi:hypothetical protein, conserved [Leishmania tarentolae]|uniref:Uncharacterized protein n=1 Tax=Leishmania tarentolae TaxID=5689 RepID=A0A640KB19_LEITA|nr:hypothetical protein, conserved [Leishmania tarentolae]
MMPAAKIHRLILIVAGIVVLLGNVVSGVRVGVAKCGGIIPIDSQYILDPIWGFRPLGSRIERLSKDSLIFEKRFVSEKLRKQIVMESGTDVSSVTVFEIVPTTRKSTDATGLTNVRELCSVSLDPLAGAMDGVVSRGARLAFLNAGPAENETCSSGLNVSLQPHQGDATWVYFARGKLGYSNSITLVSASSVTWPMTLTFTSECAVQLILLLDRYGAIDRWFVWIPATVYTAAVVAILLPIVLLCSRLHVHLVGIFLFLVFLGFFGSCIGLVVELLQWQSSVGRLYPFPDSVTLYCCLCLLYTLLFVPVLYRQGSNRILFMGVTRLLIFGLNCALCIGYWIMGFVVLGSLAVLQYLATNLILTYYYAYISVYLQRAMKETSSLPKLSNNFVYLWCAPVTPFACCALMYYELYLLNHRNVERDPVAARMRDAVRIYSAQLSLPLLFFQNVYGAALLATACAYHMPFVTLLFVALLLLIVHSIYIVEQCTKEWARWHRRGHSLGFWGCLSLSASMKALCSVNYGANASRTASLSPSNVQQTPQPNQHERGIAAYQTGEAFYTSSTENNISEVVSPPLPLFHHSGHNHELASQRRPANNSAGSATFPTRHVNGALEFWPSRLER